MTRNRWLAVLLIGSWTLNVALIVALFYSRCDRQPPRFPPFGIGGPGGPPPPASCIPPEGRRMMKAAMAPFAEDQQRLSEELMLALTSDSLDTIRVMRYSDSLADVKVRMQAMMVRHITSLHGQMPPEERRELCKRMIGRFEHPKPGRDGHRRERRKD